MCADVCLARLWVRGDDANIGEEPTEAVAFTLGEPALRREEGWVSRFAEKVEAEIDQRSRLVHDTGGDINVDQHPAYCGSNGLEVAAPQDHSRSYILRFLVCEETPNVKWILERWFHANDNVKGSDGGKNCIVVGLGASEVTLEDLGVDLGDLCEADFVRFGACSCLCAISSSCGRASEVDFKLVLARIFRIGEDEFVRGIEVLPAVVDATRCKHGGSAFRLQRFDDFKVESRGEDLFGWRNDNVIVADDIVRDLSSEMVCKDGKGATFFSIARFSDSDSLDMSGEDDLAGSSYLRGTPEWQPGTPSWRRRTSSGRSSTSRGTPSWSSSPSGPSSRWWARWHCLFKNVAKFKVGFDNTSSDLEGRSNRQKQKLGKQDGCF